ncbi:hypothetical protein TcBrA4_0092820 [Trypanosoma cruzi]|nr:hypothetical protein TcBrA4_0092820 [Trypanosoma cruzi]
MRGFRGESGAALPGAREAAAVDELGEAYRSATPRASSGGASRGGGRRSRSACRRGARRRVWMHRDAVDSRRERCAPAWSAPRLRLWTSRRGVQEATHERAVEALAAEEDAARGQLVGGSARTCMDAPRCRGFRGESGAQLPGGRRGCGCGRARRGVQERDARASSGGASRGGGRRSRSACRRGR